jgi:hypothetical protein
MSIRKSVFKIHLEIWRLYNRVLSRKKKKILFDCQLDFHYYHIQPLLEFLRHDPAFMLTVLKCDGFSHQELQGIRYIDADILLNESWAVYDIYFTTDFGTIPWWFIDVTTMFFLHGVGPKVSYFASEKLKDFDVVLAPGPYVESKQIPFLKEGGVLYRAGLPVTDHYFLQETFSLPPYLKFDNPKPVLLYAPSWSNDYRQFSIDLDILGALSRQEVCNVIIRPHPNLLIPEKCNGIDWREIIAEIMLTNKRIALHAGSGTSIYDILGCTDILLGDISSIVYEFLVFDRPIILYLKNGVGDFYQSGDFILETKRACYNMEDADELEIVLLDCLGNKESLSAERKTMLAKSLHNPGRAVPEIIKILNEL